MTQVTVSHEGCTWKFSEDSCREYSAALTAAEAEVSKRFGPRPGFGSPGAIAAWEHEVVTAAHARLFGDNRPVYKGARLPPDTSEPWATVEAFRRGVHSPVNRQLRNLETGLPVWVASVRGKQFDNNSGVDWRSCAECPTDFDGREVSVAWRAATEEDLAGKTPAYRHAALGSADGWSRFRQHYE